MGWLNINGNWIGRHSGKSWSSYWTPSKLPTGVTASFVINTVSGKIDWTDNTSGRAQYEVWSSTNGAAAVLCGTTSVGAITYSDTTCKQNASVVYKIRGLVHGYYSDFVTVAAINTPLCWKTDQSTLTQVIINSMIIKTDKTVVVNWGDGVTENLTGTVTSKTHDYASTGTYNISLSGDLNDITRIYHYNQVKSYGDLTNWILPIPNAGLAFGIHFNNFYGDISNWIVDKNTTSFRIEGNDFTGSLPNLNGTVAGGIDYQAYGNKLTGSNLTNFKAAATVLNIKDQADIFPASEIDKLLKAIADFYQVTAPIKDCAYTMTGANMGVPTNGALNADIVRTKGYYTAAAKTATFTINEPVPFDNQKLLITLDGNFASLYTVLYPILVAKGVKGTFYTWSDGVGASGAYTWANCLTMHTAGMEIQDHSKDHLRMTDKTEAELIADCLAVNAAFVANGLPSPTHIAYPFGSNNALVRSVVDDYRQTGRNFIYTINTNVQYKNLLPFDFGVNWIDDHDGVDFDVEAFEDILDKAVTENGLVVTLSHKGHTSGVYEYGSTKASVFEAIIDMAIAKGFDIITISQLKTALDS